MMMKLKNGLNKLKRNNMETLEEALERLYPENIIKLGNNTSYDAALIKRKDFTDGVNWQADQSQEAINKLISIIEWYDNESDVRPDLETFMWFKQFKKEII
jgi:glyceraldehyde-3-phosphate dehydrogenase/erythrose-4-phosphate dehydrogenase